MDFEQGRVKNLKQELSRAAAAADRNSQTFPKIAKDSAATNFYSRDRIELD